MAFGKGLFDFQHLGALEVPDFGGDALQARGHQGQGLNKMRVAVPGHHLSRDGLRPKAQATANSGFNRGIQVGEIPHGPGQFAESHFRAGLSEADAEAYAEVVRRGGTLVTVRAEEDLADRVLHNLVGQELPGDLTHLREPCIIIAYDLKPSQTATLDRRFVLGFATEQGSETSHTAILARSLQIPAVTGLEAALSRVRTGQYALLDGFGGVLVVEAA